MWVKNCIRHRLSLMGGDSYRNALLMIKGCYPQQRWSDCVCTGGKPRLRLLAEQTRQQRNQGDAYQSNAAASHELLHALRLELGSIAAKFFIRITRELTEWEKPQATCCINLFEGRISFSGVMQYSA